MPNPALPPDRRPSFWLQSLPGTEFVPRPSLAGDTQVDVAIVGGGFTGLWTALYLLRSDPSLRVLVIEAEFAGFGASGRNGGWVSALLPMSLNRVAATTPTGRSGAMALLRAMEASVDEVGTAAADEGIDCDYAKGGYLHTATSPAQIARLHDDIRWSEEWGVTGIEWLDRRAVPGRVGIAGALAATFTPHCAAIHPAKLVRGLARAVERRGGTIVEGTRVSSIEPSRVHTDHGAVQAAHIVRALEGFTPGLARSKRHVAPIYSLMVATSPLPSEFWLRAGLGQRAVFNDARRRVIYGQRTADDRIAFGGRGAFYHWGSAIRPEFDHVERVHDAIRATLRALFPYLPDEMDFTHAWGGPLGAPRDWHCSVGLDQRTGIGWAGGYVGDGVTTTNLAGRTLADLILRRDTDLTRLPWVGHQSPSWEPEPFRWLGVNAGLALAGVADRYETRHGRSSRIVGGLLDRLTGH